MESVNKEGTDLESVSAYLFTRVLLLLSPLTRREEDMKSVCVNRTVAYNILTSIKTVLSRV